jgi:peptidase M28-like protein/PA domain-containing protein
MNTRCSRSLAALALVLGGSSTLLAQALAPPAVAPLAPVKLHSTVEFLASDALEGRRAGTHAADVAAKFVASEFLRMGLRPAGPDGSWFQTFDCGVRRLGDGNVLRATPASGDAADFVLGKDWLPFLFSASGEASGEVVFAGFGLPEDYATLGASVRGKIALVRRGLPSGSAARDPRATYLAKAREAARNGATALLVVSGTKDASERVPGRQIWPNFGAGGGLLGLGTSIATMFPSVKKELEEVNMTKADVDEQTALVTQYEGPLGSSSIPAALASSHGAVAALLGGEDGAIACLDSDAAPPRAIPSVRATVRVDVVPSGQHTANVLALLPGTDEKLRDEWVIVGAHYDHVGENEAGEVWNGADDNASGTATMLGIAEALAAGPPPKRSVLFVAFGAEEKGLLGSMNYLDDPAVPLAQTVAMVNLDMVGRNKPDHVTLIGARSSPEVQTLAERAAKDVGMTLDDDGEPFFDQSDHAGFYHRGIPVAFLTTMEHADYHHATDTADKIDGDKMERIARLTLAIVRGVADADARPTYVPYRSDRRRAFGQDFLETMFKDDLRR